MACLSPTEPRLRGKVALITGAARGIGEIIAKVFAKHGAKIVIVDVLDKLGESVCQEIGPNVASYIHCDVSIESDMEKAINTTIAKHGKLDIMVNNAIVIDEPKLSILDNHVSDFERVISVNLTGAFIGTKQAARAMIPSRSGSIITMGSVCSSIGGVASHAYTSSKHGVVGLTRNVAAELGQFNIRVNCLSPYFVALDAAKGFFKLDDDGANKVYSNLKGHILKAQDVAEAALFLASDESKYMSGHNMALDGGFTAINPAFGLFSRIQLGS